MEILVVLVIFAMSTAIIMPSLSRMLDQATAHAVFFDFQRQVSDLRQEANRTGVEIRLIDPEADLAPRAARDANDRVITIRSPWRYTMAPALVISEGGACSPATVNLITGDKVVMVLKLDSATCQFIRQQ